VGAGGVAAPIGSVFGPASVSGELEVYGLKPE